MNFHLLATRFFECSSNSTLHPTFVHACIHWRQLRDASKALLYSSTLISLIHTRFKFNLSTAVHVNAANTTYLVMTYERILKALLS